MAYKYLTWQFFLNFLQARNVQYAWWNMNWLFSVDLMLIDARIHTFLNKIPTKNFPFENFPLVQFLLIILSIKVTYIRNGCLAWVAYSQLKAIRYFLKMFKIGKEFRNTNNWVRKSENPVSEIPGDINNEKVKPVN